MPLTHFFRWVTAAAFGGCLLLSLRAWGAQHQFEPTSSPEASEAFGEAQARALMALPEVACVGVAATVLDGGG